MRPPKLFKVNPKRRFSYSQCMACANWKSGNNIFHHGGRNLILCKMDYEDYWENTDKLLSDYVGYNV